MNTVFQRSDFVLCKAPVPDGYKQSQTHSGVASYNGKYFLTTSPYPSGGESKWKSYLRVALSKLRINLIKPFIPEQWENPLLYIGVKQKNEDYPTNFNLLQRSPLLPPPDPYYGLPAFNSDPDIFIEDGFIHVLGRQTYRTEMCPGQSLNKYKNRLYRIYGRIDENRFFYLGTDFILETEQLFVSPCLTKYNGLYVMTELETNAYNDGVRYDGLFLTVSNSINQIGKGSSWSMVDVKSGNYLPWHMSLFTYNNRLYSIVACVEKGIGHRLWQMIGEFSEDLKSLTIYQTPLTDYRSYRGGALVDDNGIFIIYNTTVRERLKGGKSVDGREIIMAHMPFEQLLKIVRENEV